MKSYRAIILGGLLIFLPFSWTMIFWFLNRFFNSHFLAYLLPTIGSLGFMIWVTYKTNDTEYISLKEFFLPNIVKDDLDRFELFLYRMVKSDLVKMVKSNKILIIYFIFWYSLLEILKVFTIFTDEVNHYIYTLYKICNRYTSDLGH